MTPPVIPDHTLLRLIGRGSYGEVWLARNIMGVLRAVKIVSRRQFDSDRPYEREFAGIERYEPVSRSADGLVHVLHVGRNEPEQYFYYVMELADDAGTVGGESKTIDPAPTDPGIADYFPRTLRSDLQRVSRLPVADCLRLSLDAVGGLTRLHERGLVHRDVKPGNIIYVEGRAKLADVGLVSKGGEGRTFVGTEGYIPPEGPGSALADLYALGMVLYEAATGYPPDKFPKVPPEWFADDANPEALEFHEIVLKACEGDPERRYRSAGELQADLAFLQSGQSVRQLHALQKRVRTWRAIGWAAAVCVTLAMGIALFSNWRARVEAENRGKETQLKNDALTAQLRAEKAEREARLQLHAALLEQARATVRSAEMGHRVQALAAIQRAAAISNSPALRREVFAALSLPDLRYERTLPYGGQFPTKRLDPNFKRIALAPSRGPVEIRSVTDDQLLCRLPATTNLAATEVWWSPDGRFLGVKRDSTSNRGVLEVWEGASGRLVLIAPDLRWNAYAFQPRSPRLLTGGTDGRLSLWDLETGREVATARAEAEAERFGYSPDGRFIAAFYARTEGWGVSVHRTEDSAIISSNILQARIAWVEWHPGGEWLAVTDLSGAVHSMDARTGALRLIGQHKAEAVRAVFSPDGAYLITGGWERELICWDVANRRNAFGIGLNSYQAQFSSENWQCSTLDAFGTLQLHAFERPVAHREFADAQTVRVRHAAISRDGRWVAASTDQRLMLWDVAANGPPAVVPEAFNAHCQFTPDGSELYASKEGFAVRWAVVPASNPIEPPQLEKLPLTRPTGFLSLALRSNDVVINSSRGSQLVRPGTTDTATENWAKTERGNCGVSPDGKWFAVFRSFGSTLNVYALPGLEPVAQINPPRRVGDFQFSPRGDELAIGSSRAGLTFWDTTTWQQTRSVTNFARIHYTADPRLAWLVQDSRSAGLYDLKTLEPVLQLPTGMQPLSMSAEGQRIVVSVDARKLQLWDLALLRAELSKLGLDWSEP